MFRRSAVKLSTSVRQSKGIALQAILHHPRIVLRFQTTDASLQILRAAERLLIEVGPQQDDGRVSNTGHDVSAIRTALERHQVLKQSREETAVQLVNLRDEDMKILFRAELETLDDDLAASIARLTDLVAYEPLNHKLPVLLSINPGIGGAEATFCAATMNRMYQRYAEMNGWSVEILSQTDGTSSKNETGLREITMRISGGSNIYGKLRWETGVHRMQRVPSNENKGRIHSSTAAVIVLPIHPEEDDSDIVDNKDVKMEVMRSRGAGGQHVNKTESAVRLTHIPTGISVSMQDSRSQHQNRALAWEVLRARLFAKKEVEDAAARRDVRLSKVSGTDRSDKIRSYNVPADRCTDHRIGYAELNLSAIFDGGLDNLVTALSEEFHHRRLASIANGEGDLDE